MYRANWNQPAVCLTSHLMHAYKECYILCGLLSYARRYWRKALKRKTQGEVAMQLLSVLKPNPRKFRLSCRGKRKVKGRPPGEWGVHRTHRTCWFCYSTECFLMVYKPCIPFVFTLACGCVCESVCFFVFLVCVYWCVCVNLPYILKLWPLFPTGREGRHHGSWLWQWAHRTGQVFKLREPSWHPYIYIIYAWFQQSIYIYILL